MLADRPYRRGMPLEQMLGILRRDVGVDRAYVAALDLVAERGLSATRSSSSSGHS
jgi:hypothetical protein